jgi:antirestriction protein ArdC
MVLLVEFQARGIEAHPREDCFTFNAWKALNRHVKKGEHGVKIMAYAHTERQKPDGTTEAHDYPTTATVFHVSQTEPDTEQVTA